VAVTNSLYLNVVADIVLTLLKRRIQTGDIVQELMLKNCLKLKDRWAISNLKGFLMNYSAHDKSGKDLLFIKSRADIEL
jgi:hypothetical protein